MNPCNVEMMKSYRAYCALTGKDTNCEKYIEFASGISETITVAANADAKAKGAETGENPLVGAIVKGLKERASSLTAEYLQTTEPIKIIDENIIPALDIVGKGFEAKTMFLPQLLMSAEAASGAFDEIRNKLEREGNKGESKGKIIIATVKGDIHDIGKNIVKTLLENYGYEVFDLGKDVAPEVVVETAIRENVKMVGLSALMTTTVPAMEETIKQLREKCPSVRVCVGGAVLTQKYADMIGADKYAHDAMETVRYAEELFAAR